MGNKDSNQLKGIILLLASAFIYSTMPVMIRVLGGGGLPPMSQVFLRYIFAFLTALIYFFEMRVNEFKDVRQSGEHDVLKDQHILIGIAFIPDIESPYSETSIERVKLRVQ